MEWTSKTVTKEIHFYRETGAPLGKKMPPELTDQLRVIREITGYQVVSDDDLHATPVPGRQRRQKSGLGL